MFNIYIIENLVNGKMYVGQTVNLSDRKRSHFSPSSKCPYISNAIQKYGKINFNFYLLEKHGTLEESNVREIYWIKELGTLSPGGYNLREGGDAGGRPSQETIEKVRRANLGRKQTEEEKEKRAASHRGRKNSPDTIEKMRQAAKNKLPEKCSMFGKKHSEETRRKMSSSNTKTHCKRGHPLHGPEADVWLNSKGYPNCNRCRRFVRSGTVS